MYFLHKNQHRLLYNKHKKQINSKEQHTGTVLLCCVILANKGSPFNVIKGSWHEVTEGIKEFFILTQSMLHFSYAYGVLHTPQVCLISTLPMLHFSLRHYFTNLIIIIAPPRITRITPTARLSVFGLALFASFDAICAKTSVDMMHKTRH